MPPALGLILTHAPDLAWLRTHLKAARAECLKVVPAWGLAGGWTPPAIVEAAYLCPRLIVRTSWGDPSYADGARAMPFADQVLAEVAPWVAARDDLAVEIGNEPLIAEQPEDVAWEYQAHLAAAVTALRQACPRAQIIAPAHMRDHAVRLGDHRDGQRRWDEIAGPTYRRCDILGLHAYSVTQALAGIHALRDLVSATAPIWLTEFALHEALDDDARGARYADVLSALPVEVACLYHLDASERPTLAAQGPAMYRLAPATLTALARAPTVAPPPRPRPLADLGIIDSRSSLGVIAARRPKPRQGPPRSVTLHYNGPAVSGFGTPTSEWRRVVKVDVPDHQTRLSADSLQYHFVVLSNGEIHQTRDLALPAWHCGHTEGNQTSLAVHLVLGGTQDATPAQWAATERLFTALIAEFDLPGRAAVKAHSEWKATLCPGPNLTRRLEAWRAGAPPAGGLYRIRADVAAANVREGPGVRFPVALQGKAVMWPGDVLDADAITSGEAVGGEARWLHRRDGLGFVHWSVATPLRSGGA